MYQQHSSSSNNNTPPPHPPILQVPVRETCPWCDGKGHVGAALPYCARCLQQWTPAYLASHLGPSWHFSWNPFKLFATRLPCGHVLKLLCYTDPTCSACRGEGGHIDWIPLAALRHIAGWFDRTKPTQFGVDHWR